MTKCEKCDSTKFEDCGLTDSNLRSSKTPKFFMSGSGYIEPIAAILCLDCGNINLRLFPQGLARFQQRIAKDKNN